MHAKYGFARMDVLKDLDIVHQVPSRNKKKKRTIVAMYLKHGPVIPWDSGLELKPTDIEPVRPEFCCCHTCVIILGHLSF